MSKEKTVEAKINEVDQIMKRLSELLATVEKIVHEDRKACLEWYEQIKDRWEEDEIGSEMASLEREVNNALKNLNNSTEKLPKMLDTIGKISSALIKERALLTISAGFQEKQIDMDNPDDKLRMIQEAQQVKELNAKVEKSFIQDR